MPTAYSLLPDRFPRDRLTTAISIHQAGVKAGTALAFSVGAALLALFAKPVWAFGVEWHNWQLVFLTTSLPGLAVAFLIFTFREPARRAVIGKDAAETGKGDLISFLKANQRFCWLMMAGFGSIAICAAACASWVPTFLTRSYHMKPIVFGPILAFISVITAFVLVAKGVIVDFLARRGMIDAPLRFYTWILGASLPLGLSFELPSAWLFLILYGAIIVVTIPYMVWVSSTIQLVVPARLRGQITGFFLFGLTLLGLGLGPMIVAFITDGILRDESKLGLSLAIVLTTGLGVAFFTLRAALSPASKLIASHGAA